MAQTAVEKIFSRHTKKPVNAGDLTIVSVDAVMAQDGNAPLAIKLLKENLNAKSTFDSSKVILVIDHCGPSPNEGASNLQKMMRTFCNDFGATLYDVGEGISHVLLPEQGHAQPGRIIIGSDSHSVTYGAVNCVGTGMGSTDIAVAMYTGKVWMKVPDTIRINLSGKLQNNATAKDLILKMISVVGVNGATYKCLEISGEGLSELNMDNRFTICNMAIEMGAKCALMPVDQTCKDYLNERNVFDAEEVWSDEGCNYEKVYNINLDEVLPMVVLPHDLTNIVPATQIKLQKIDMAFIGTCTNSRLSDLEEAALVLKDKKIHNKVRLIITPGTRKIYLEALQKGFIENFILAGAIVTPPGCGPCVGTHMGIPGDDEIVISTANRNFKGRMGNSNASIFLASPATVAASAIMGRIATFEEVSYEIAR